MLELTIEINPYGTNRNKRDIAKIWIANVSQPTEFSFNQSYLFMCYDPTYDKKQVVGLIHNHERNTSSFELIKKVMEKRSEILANNTLLELTEYQQSVYDSFIKRKEEYIKTTEQNSEKEFARKFFSLTQNSSIL